MSLTVMITSDEQEETLVDGFRLLKEVLPPGAFYSRGVEQGPLLAMTDDSSSEWNALRTIWPGTRLLLYSFHFLQRKWTWLHDGQNRIADKDRAILINKQNVSCMLSPNLSCFVCMVSSGSQMW